MNNKMTAPAEGSNPEIRVREFEEALLSVDRQRSRTLVSENCDPNDPARCVEELIVPALNDIGTRWETGEISLSQVYMSGRICESLVDTMLPPGNSGRKNQPKIAIAVLEDQHALGKRIVYSVLRSAGFDVTDYGAGVSVEDLGMMVKRDGIEVLLVSTLMLRAALRVKDLMKVLRNSGSETRVIVGGAPFNFDHELWKEVGADAWSPTASEVIPIIGNLKGLDL